MSRFADRPARYSPRVPTVKPDTPEKWVKNPTVGESLFFFDVKLVADEGSARVEGYCTPRECLPLFVRVYQTTKNARWQCYVACGGIHAQIGGATPAEALRETESAFGKLVEVIKCLRD